MGKQKKEKQIPGIDEGFLAEVATLDVAGKKAKIARLEAHKQEAQEFLKTNETIIGLKEELKEIEGPARDTVKASKNRQKHLIGLLREVGEFSEPRTNS